MKYADSRIIEAVLSKAERECPGALDMVAVYGSSGTEDEYEKSDLDLMILINDERGWQLSDGFILDDTHVGYDIYCTTWEGLEGDAECRHAHISKLMEPRIVYAAGDAVRERLNRLQDRARAILSSAERYARVDDIGGDMRREYADALLSDGMGEARAHAAYAITLALDMVMLWNGRYFRRGVKRTFDEIKGLELPDGFTGGIMDVICAQDMDGLRRALTGFVKGTLAFAARSHERTHPSKENIAGTYEEMFSNWRNKMHEAAANGDVFASFMNMASLHFMMDDIAGDVDIADTAPMAGFDAHDLAHNASAFDDVLARYLDEYRRAGIEPKHFADVDEFVRAYLAQQ